MTLNHEQLNAATDTHPMVLCVAGAGSGKTRTLVARIEHWLKTYTPSSIVAVTFTNQAADEIMSRLPKGTELAYAGTLHGLMLRILQKYGHLIGFKQWGISVMDEAQSHEMVKEIIRELNLKTNPTQLWEALPTGWALVAWHVGAATKPAVIGAAEYYQRMRNNNLLDFDSILRFGHLAIEKARHKNVWKENWVCLAVDELQDSSFLDYDIYDSLPVHNRFYVGDDNQALYGWRGGDVKLMLALAARPTTKLLTLEVNYRSDMDICAVANQLISYNKNRIEKRLVPVSERPGSLRYCVPMDSPADEASYIAMDIKDCQRIHSFDECAVLLRTNALVQFFAKELERRGIPVRKTQWDQLPPDWTKCRMFLNLLVNPENDMLAHWWLKETRGEHEANRIKLEALKKLTSINKHFLKVTGVTLAAVPELLAKASIGVESVARIDKAIASLKPGDGLPELSLRMGAMELHRDETKETGVTVCTAHAAKGREWPCVYVPCLNHGVWPPGKEHDIEEERRVLYVAVTRAENKLVLSYSKTAFDWSMKPKPALVSAFWKEMQ